MAQSGIARKPPKLQVRGSNPRRLVKGYGSRTKVRIVTKQNEGNFRTIVRIPAGSFFAKVFIGVLTKKDHGKGRATHKHRKVRKST